MTHPLCVSHYCGVVRAVGLGGHSLCMAIEDKAVNIGEHVQLGLRSRVPTRRVGDARAIHRALRGAAYAAQRRGGVTVGYPPPCSNANRSGYAGPEVRRRAALRT